MEKTLETLENMMMDYSENKAIFLFYTKHVFHTVNIHMGGWEMYKTALPMLCHRRDPQLSPKKYDFFRHSSCIQTVPI